MARLVGRPWFAWGCGSERSKVAGGPERRLPPAPVLKVANAVVGIPGRGPRLLPHPFK